MNHSPSSKCKCLLKNVTTARLARCPLKWVIKNQKIYFKILNNHAQLDQPVANIELLLISITRSGGGQACLLDVFEFDY